MSLNDDAIALYQQGNKKEAFQLACRFTMSFSKEELRDIQRAYEALVRPGSFEMFGWTDDVLVKKGDTAFTRFIAHLKERKDGINN